MKRSFLFSFVLFAAMGSAHAACYGTAAYRTCTDTSGNSYTTRQAGNTAYTDGYNAQTGTSWSQSTRRSGNTSTTNGYDANGNRWNATSRRSGNTTYTNGVDSNGNTFSGQVRTNGRTTTYSGIDSKGKAYYKTCTATGCF